MKRNKYLNTFDNTADYENYIESAYPGFPNVGLTKDNGELHYVRTRPNVRVLYGEVVNPSQPLPTIYLDGTVNTPTLDASSNMFYLYSWSNAAPTSISFDNKENIKTITKLKGLDTSNVTDMNNMFILCTSLTSLDLSSFNTSNVTDMSSMFLECSSLTSLDLSNFNTSNVTSMSEMFNGCSSLTSLDLSNFNTSNVTNMDSMFSTCTSLTSLYLSNWDVSSVTNTNAMFDACISLTDVYITVEATLNKLTNNLTSQGGINYIPQKATIHYNGVDYKWTGSAWTPQN